MSNLGISTLFSQKVAGETAESKRLSRTDSDSLIAIVSKNLQNSLQMAMDMAGAYIGIEAPEVMIDRDFDLQVLDSGQIQQYMQLWSNGAITHQTLLEMLKKGEVLPEIDIEREIELTEQERGGGMMVSMLPQQGEEVVEVEADADD
jgi:hypothetical protein